MPARIGFCLLLLLSLTSCATVPDRYAFWRDNQPIPAGTKKPNLGDVPTPPDVTATRTEIAAMREKLTADRDASYKAASTPETTDITFSNLAPMTSDTAARLETNASDDRAVAQDNSNVIYNYGATSSTSAYSYDNEAVQINHVDDLQRNTGGPTAGGDPSVVIDWSALGGAPAGNQMASLTGQPSIFFNYGSARISANDRRSLRRIAQQVGSGGVTVSAFASQRTGLKSAIAAKDVNLRMSAQRASAVLRELAKAGVPADGIKLIANGDSMASGQDTQDRRVDLRVN